MITLLLYCLFILLSISSIARIEGFSSSKIPSTYHVSSKNPKLRLKGITVIQFNHNRIHRPLFGTAIDSDIQKKKTQATAKKKRTNNKSKYRKKYKQKKTSSTNNKYQKHNKYRRKQKQRSKSANTSRQQSTYEGPTKDELKALTEYHLSQNINTNDCSTLQQQSEEECLSNDDEDMSCSICSYGDMSTQQMDEFARLISSWYKLQSSKEMKSRQDKLLAAEMAEQCLRELIEERIVGKNILANNNRITTDLYYTVIKSWLNVADNGKFGKNKSYYSKDLLHATSLLDLMERTHDMNSKDESSRDDKFISSSIKCYATILDGWCKSKSPGSEAKSEEILHRMTSIGGGAVDVRYYNNVMNRIASSGKNNAGVEAERLLNQLIDLYKKNSNKASAPNRNSFNTVIKAYANSGDKESSTNVQRILNMMEHPESLGLPDSIAKQIIPDKFSYTSILNDWAYNGSDDENVGERAEELIQQMYDIYNKSNSDDSDRRKDVKPDTVTYNAVLKVWGKCGHPDSGERSIVLLGDMIQRYKDGDSNVTPDDVTYNSVINNIANSKSEDSPQRAMQLLEEMESSYESGLIKSKPDIISYNSVLKAFAKQGGYTSAKRAEEMLNKLEESYDARATTIQPDVISYNIVISAWGGDANKAVALLDRMRYRTNEGKAQLKPDITTYNSILNAWSQSTDRNAPVKALGLLEIMLRLHEGGDTSAKPDVQSFTTVINAFSKSKFPRKARQTRDLLKRMKSLNDKGQIKMRPNVFVYAAVLNACAYTFGRSEEKEEALQVAIETYDELQASMDIETNHVAYGSFIRVCRRLISDESERDKYITRVFRQCCNDGQVGDYVLRQLRAVPSLYKSLLQEYIDEYGYGDDVVYQELPKRWTCNVKEGRGR